MNSISISIDRYIQHWAAAYLVLPLRQQFLNWFNHQSPTTQTALAFLLECDVRTYGTVSLAFDVASDGEVKALKIDVAPQLFGGPHYIEVPISELVVLKNALQRYSILGLLAFISIKLENAKLCAPYADDPQYPTIYGKVQKSLNAGLPSSSLEARLARTEEQLSTLRKELLWVIEDVWPLVHGLTSRQTVKERFARLRDLLEKR